MASVPNSIPPHARRAFNGEVFKIWQWEQTLFDGSVKIFERAERPPTIIIFAVVGDSIIIQKQTQPQRDVAYFSLPGGAGEWGEDPLTAAKRELLEETGLVSSDWELLRATTPFSKLVWTIAIFVARDCREGSPKPEAGERIENFRITFDELLAYADHPLFQDNAVIELLVRARYDAQAKAAFHQKLFGR